MIREKDHALQDREVPLPKTECKNLKSYLEKNPLPQCQAQELVEQHKRSNALEQDQNKVQNTNHRCNCNKFTCTNIIQNKSILRASPTIKFSLPSPKRRRLRTCLLVNVFPTIKTLSEVYNQVTSLILIGRQ